MIKSASKNDENYIKTTNHLQRNEENLQSTDLSIDKTRSLRFKNKLYLANSIEFKMLILDELHNKPYSGHPGY
jgi:hypothetical protein